MKVIWLRLERVKLLRNGGRYVLPIFSSRCLLYNKAEDSRLLLLVDHKNGDAR